MELTGIILIAVLVVVLVHFVMIYNQLVQIKHNVSKAWANIDDSIVASLAAFKPFELLKFSDEEKRDVDVNQLLQV